MTARLNRLMLLIRCLLRAVVQGTAKKVPKNISRIIIVPTGKLGDVVCCTPVLAAVRKYLPAARLIVAGNAKLHRPLLAGLADEFLDLESPGALGRIIECRADAAILTGHSFEYGAKFYLAGIPFIVGPRAVGIDSPEETRPYMIFLSLIASFPHHFKAYAPRERLRSLEPLGIATDETAKRLGFSDEAREKAAKMLAAIPGPYRFLVGMSVGAGNKEKRWPPKNFAAVANHLIKNHGVHVILIGGKQDAQESAEFVSAVETTNVTDTVGIPLDELKALIARLDLFISVNTGPLYIAEAFDVPTVDILGPVNAWDQPPRGRIHKMVFPPGNPRPLLYMLDSRRHDVREAERIAQSTRVEDVIEAAEQSLAEIEAGKQVSREQSA